MLMVLKQPDLGTALTYSPILLCGLFLGGIRWKQAMILGLAGAIMAVGTAWYSGKVLKPYQKARLTSFVNPDNDPKGSGYQIRQSLIAVGSGGIWGKGATKGTQTQGDFPADSLYGFHLCGVLRGTRVRRRSGGAAAILLHIDAFDTKRSNSCRSSRNVSCNGRRRRYGFSNSGECRDGGRVDACNRNSFTVNELRGIFGSVLVSGSGDGNERPHEPLRELGL